MIDISAGAEDEFAEYVLTVKSDGTVWTAGWLSDYYYHKKWEKR